MIIDHLFNHACLYVLSSKAAVNCGEGQADHGEAGGVDTRESQAAADPPTHQETPPGDAFFTPVLYVHMYKLPEVRSLIRVMLTGILVRP